MRLGRIAQVQARALMALAATSANRLKELPEVPTMVELGFKDFVVEQRQGIDAPAGTSTVIVLGVNIAGGKSDVLAQQRAADYERWGKVIRAANIKIE